jgi:WD40 repeat protein
MSRLRSFALLAGLLLLAPQSGRLSGQQARSPAPKPAVDLHGDPLPVGARARLGTVRFRTPAYMNTAALSPDGKVLVAGNYQTLVFFDPATGRQLRQDSPGFVSAQSLTFSPDGKTLASLDHSNRVQLRSAADGKPIRQLQAPGAQQRVLSAAFSGDGKILAAGVESFNQSAGSIHLWEAASGTYLRRIDVLQNFRVLGALSADGKLLVTWGSYANRGPGPNAEPGRTLQLWDVGTGKELRQFKIDLNFTVAHAALSPDGKTLAATSGGSTVYLWETATGLERGRLAGRRGLNAHLAFAPDGKAVAAAGYDGTVQMWELPSGRRLGLCEGPAGRFSGMAFVGNRRVLAWGIDGQTLSLWEAPSGKRVTPPVAHQTAVTSLRFVAGGKELISAGLDGRVFRWDVATGKAVHQGEVRDDDLRRSGYYYGPGGVRYQSLAVSPDGKYACGGGNYGNQLRLWELPSGKAVCDFEGGGGANQGAAFSADGALVAVAGNDHAVRVWDVASGRLRRLLQLGKALPAGKRFGGYNVRALAFAPDCKTVAVSTAHYEPNTGRQVNELYAVRADTGKEVWHVKRAGGFVSALAFSPDGRFLAVGGNSGPQVAGLEMLSAATGKQIHKLEGQPGQSGQVNSLAFAPDGRTLASGSYQYGPAAAGGGTSAVTLWELATGQPRRQFSGHQGMIQCLAFSPDGRTLASGSADTSVLLWDVAGGAPPAAAAGAGRP